MTANKQWIFAHAPNGKLATSDFELRESPIPEAKAGEVLVAIKLLSLDPASRSWMHGRTYRSPLSPGDVMAGWGIGEVISSRAPEFDSGDLVRADFGWQQYAAVPARQLTKLDKRHRPEHHMGILGTTGLTAYFGLLEIGRPRPGETVLISAAAGAVGTIAGQIAKLMGCRVVGTTSSPEKCNWLVDEIGFDAAVDYNDGEFSRSVKQACPDGIDVYFDNTGGNPLSVALSRMNVYGRVVCCGVVSNFDTATPTAGPAGVPGFLVTKRIRMEGFIVHDYASRRPAAEATLARWLEEGKIKAPVDIVDGFEKMPAALTGMFGGRNRGKLIVRV